MNELSSPPANPFSELYAAYAAGTLDPAYALMVETQCALRPDVRRSVGASEALAGGLLETAVATSLSVGALDRAFAAIDVLEAAPRKDAAAQPGRLEPGDELDTLPEPARGAARDAAGREGWKWLSPGLKRLAIDAGSPMEVELYRIEPGSRIPRHTHSGPEYTLVLSGGFTDERGSYGPGDMCLNTPDDTHTPVADDDGVCYALAIREGGLRFSGMLGTLQRLFGGG